MNGVTLALRAIFRQRNIFNKNCKRRNMITNDKTIEYDVKTLRDYSNTTNLINIKYMYILNMSKGAAGKLSSKCKINTKYE